MIFGKGKVFGKNDAIVTQKFGNIVYNIAFKIMLF